MFTNSGLFSASCRMYSGYTFTNLPRSVFMVTFVLPFLTHCQAWPPRGGEVSHGGTEMFCWMHH